MAVDDRGIVVGITIYPGISTLSGPELDAEEFYDWLTSPTGGDVPSERVEKIVSSAFQPPPPAGAANLPAQEVAQAFDRLHAAAFVSGIPRRLGRRLYVYAAGHGAGLPFMWDPDQSDAAFLLADATMFNATHVMTKVRALYFLNAGIFDEIVVFMDCCRNPVNVTPSFPSYINAVAISNLGNEPRKFFAFATKWGLNAREKKFNGETTRGIFTTALMAGLKGAAANPDGTINSTSLRNYLIANMQNLLTPAEMLDSEVQKLPDVPAPSVELVFTTVPPPRVTVSVTFPANAANQLIRLRGDGFKILASGQTPANGPWVIPEPQPRGGYLVEIPNLNLEKAFNLIGNERTFDVAL